MFGEGQYSAYLPDLSNFEKVLWDRLLVRNDDSSVSVAACKTGFDGGTCAWSLEGTNCMFSEYRVENAWLVKKAIILINKKIVT